MDIRTCRNFRSATGIRPIVQEVGRGSFVNRRNNPACDVSRSG